jgi:nicotinate-nucleotide pyrophosphorylase (carboxylating)
MTLFDFSTDAIAHLAQLDAARALAEDVGRGDLTAALVDPARRARARVLLRESAVLCGQPWAQAALYALAPQAQMHWQVAEGARGQANEVVLRSGGWVVRPPALPSSQPPVHGCCWS